MHNTHFKIINKKESITKHDKKQTTLLQFIAYLQFMIRVMIRMFWCLVAFK